MKQEKHKIFFLYVGFDTPLGLGSWSTMQISHFCPKDNLSKIIQISKNQIHNTKINENKIRKIIILSCENVMCNGEINKALDFDMKQRPN